MHFEFSVVEHEAVELVEPPAALLRGVDQLSRVVLRFVNRVEPRAPKITTRGRAVLLPGLPADPAKVVLIYRGKKKQNTICKKNEPMNYRKTSLLNIHGNNRHLALGALQMIAAVSFLNRGAAKGTGLGISGQPLKEEMKNTLGYRVRSIKWSGNFSEGALSENWQSLWHTIMRHRTQAQALRALSCHNPLRFDTAISQFFFFFLKFDFD